VWIDDVCYPDQPFVVLREATHEEWIADQVPGAEPKPRCDPAEALFYEVSREAKPRQHRRNRYRGLGSRT